MISGLPGGSRPICSAMSESSSAGLLASRRRMTFVGRVHELELFRSALAAPPAPFSVLYVCGPGGIGKTSLLRAWARWREGWKRRSGARRPGCRAVSRAMSDWDSLGQHYPEPAGRLVQGQGRAERQPELDERRRRSSPRTNRRWEPGRHPHSSGRGLPASLQRRRGEITGRALPGSGRGPRRIRGRWLGRPDRRSPAGSRPHVERLHQHRHRPGPPLEAGHLLHQQRVRLLSGTPGAR